MYGQVLQAMLEFNMTRKDLLVAVGGGVVGDLGGFCAASYMRGIDFVNCPTTTLSQIDSSIGGKTAIDLGETKNIVGAFWQPKVVLVDFDALATLPRRHFVNGLAEAIKAGLIADPELFALFECEHPEENIERIIYRSLRVKKNVVENDEHEQGQRACLNFGHTIGHGIEAVKGVRGRRTNGLFHGECVALGMLPMIEDKSLVRRTRAIYRTLGLPTRTGVDKNKVLSYMQHDKKSAGSTITVIKVPGLGCWRADKIPMTELPPCLASRKTRTEPMKNTFGNALGLTIFGESTVPPSALCWTAWPQGCRLDEAYIAERMDRRRARGDGLSTARTEPDVVEFLSGVVNGHTTGTPITMMIRNTNTRSGDYAKTADLLRPGHADYTAYAKYEGWQDARGGGHFSGRITAASVAAGSICEHILAQRGIKVYTHIARCAGWRMLRFPALPV